MHQKEIAEALAVAMKRDGHELDGADRLIIRNTVSGSMAAQRRRENYARSATVSFNWIKPKTPRGK
ncbi:hypothetical protein F3J38_18885 [Pantoea sp. Acro-805]|uniref:Uncharacterized protein n=1 Tax=Candidatus Pantoea formicae TaxID=2608355 RepID=A0ABX0QYN3_9GAMM|nr:hypothetical protein [Pantoea formicae]NIF02102.1 hypothetical protein [Pantoea formicae]